jgi:hypothetical protein
VAIAILVGIAFVWSSLRTLIRRVSRQDLVRLNAVDSDTPNSPGAPPVRIPDAVQELIRQGRQVEAVKALREAFGMDLTDAHTAVKRWRSADGNIQFESRVAVFSSNDMPPDILNQIQNAKPLPPAEGLFRKKDAAPIEPKPPAVTEASAAADFNSPEANPASHER